MPQNGKAVIAQAKKKYLKKVDEVQSFYLNKFIETFLVQNEKDSVCKLPNNTFKAYWNGLTSEKGTFRRVSF